MEKRKSFFVLGWIVFVGLMMSVAGQSVEAEEMTPLCRKLTARDLNRPDFLFCQTASGVYWERLILPGLGRGWMDTSSGLFWTEEVFQADYVNAENYCSKMGGYLPSLSDYEESLKLGMDEVLPLQNKSYWVNSADSGSTGTARVVAGKTGQKIRTSKRPVRQSALARCVVQINLE